MHAHGKHLLSSRLYCRYRNPYDTINHSSIQVTNSALCHQTTVCTQCSRTIPPVGDLTPPRRIYSFLFAMMVARSVNRVNRYSSIFCECTFLSKNSTASINTIAIGRQIHTFCTNPAIIYETNDTAAATTAYGSCVDTWLTWLHCAPADAMIVVSEIGEQ